MLLALWGAHSSNNKLGLDIHHFGNLGLHFLIYLDERRQAPNAFGVRRPFLRGVNAEFATAGISLVAGSSTLAGCRIAG